MLEYNIAVIGDSRVGKTSLVMSHEISDCLSFSNFNESLLIESVKNLYFDTDRGKIKCKVMEYSYIDELPHDIHAVIAMFDVTRRETYLHMRKYLDTGLPTIMCGNKCDLQGRTVLDKQITVHKLYNIQYYDISVKNNYNCEVLFMELLKLI